jgi:hypothetical protein
MNVVSNAFVASSVNRPSQTVYRITGSNSVSIACGSSPLSSANSALLSGQSSNSTARSGALEPSSAPGSLMTPRHGIAKSGIPSGAGSRSITTVSSKAAPAASRITIRGAHPKLIW